MGGLHRDADVNNKYHSMKGRRTEMPMESLRSQMMRQQQIATNVGWASFYFYFYGYGPFDRFLFPKGSGWMQ